PLVAGDVDRFDAGLGQRLRAVAAEGAGIEGRRDLVALSEAQHGNAETVETKADVEVTGPVGEAVLSGNAVGPEHVEVDAFQLRGFLRGLEEVADDDDGVDVEALRKV